MDSFLSLISTTDTKMRLSIGAKLLSFLLDSSNSIVCSDIGLFIDHLNVWLQSSNYKVVQMALDILTELIGRMRTDFQPYLATLLPQLVNKLEDSKEVIREKSSCMLLKLVDCEVVTLQNLFDKISSNCFSHKNSNVREHMLYLLCTVLDSYGSSSLLLSKLVPHVVNLLSDPNASVRSTAFDTLCKMYKHVGERLRIDLLKKQSVPANKLPLLLAKFDEIKAAACDNSLPSAFQSLKLLNEDEPDNTNSVSVHIKDAASVLKSSNRPPVTPSEFSRSKAINKTISASGAAPSNSQIGAINEETFEDSFEKVPVEHLYSGKEVEEYLKKCHDVLKNENEDWNKRVECLKKIRSLLVAGASKYEEFFEYLNMLLPAFHLSIKDLRSQVVREACITVAYLSKRLEIKFDHFAESVLNNLINLMQNSKKVIASSGLVCIRFILRYTHAPRLIPIIAGNFSSKSKEIRRACSEFMNLILCTWQQHSLEKYATTIQEAIKKGIADADAEARSHSRQTFAAFTRHFPELAESLKNSLDFSYRKLLMGNTNGGSNSSLSKMGGGEGLLKLLPRSTTPRSIRSNSAIDLQAAKRAKTRAQYAAMARQKFGDGTTATTITPKTKLKNTLPVPVAGERTGRTMNRFSISQPTSRSGSPSSRFGSYSHYLASNGSASLSRKNSIGNDLSSRETSPSRSLCSPYGFKSRYTTQPIRKPLIAQKILQQSREAESELADALGSVEDAGLYRVHRNLKTVALDDHSDESETSSMCSEHSFDSYRRPSDTMSWNGSLHRLYRDLGDPPLKDVNEIVASCESSHWNERKRGLISLQYYLQDGLKLESYDLKRVMDVFLKIFNDPHIKVFSLFLDTLNELIRSYGADLCFCLHLLLTRLLNKMGADLLNSTHSKITKTLENVFAAFPPHLQIHSLFRFLVDPTQTPNTRVKLAALHYLIKLATVADGSAVFTTSNSNSGGKDHTTLALIKIIGWAMHDNAKSTTELRRVSGEAILALFNLNTSQVARRFAEMPATYQECAAAICKLSSVAASNGEAEEGDGLNNAALPKFGRSPSSLPFLNTKSPISFSDLAEPFKTGGRAASDQKGGIIAKNTAQLHDHSDLTFSQPQFRMLRPAAARSTSVSSSSPSSSLSPSPDDSRKKSDSVDHNAGLDSAALPKFGRSPSSFPSSNPKSPVSFFDHAESFKISGKVASDSNGDSIAKNIIQLHDHSDVTFSRPQFRTLRPASVSPSSPSPDDSRKESDSFDHNAALKECIDRLCQLSDNQTAKKETLVQLTTLVRESPSDVLIANFKPLLGRVVSLMSSSAEPPLVKEQVVAMLEAVVRRKTLTFLLKQFSDLVITKVIALCGECSSKEVAKAAENCALLLSTQLPADSVARIVVPLITSEAGAVKLIAIKMLTRLIVTGADDDVALASLEQIMPVLLVAYEDVESSVRKAAVFCIVALYTKSEMVKTRVQPYLAKLRGAKLKLVHLYIEKAEQGDLFA